MKDGWDLAVSRTGYAGVALSVPAVSGCVATSEAVPVAKSVADEPLAAAASQSVRPGANVDRTGFRAQLERELLDDTFASSIAEYIGKSYGRYVSSSGREKRLCHDMATTYSMRAYSLKDVKSVSRNLPKAEIQNRMISWVQTRGVVIDEPSTVCAAGDAEIAENTKTAQFLIAK